MAIEQLPKDPMMLLSFVNTRLRDDMIDLDAFCSQFDVSREEIEKKLSTFDYTYHVDLNKFV